MAILYGTQNVDERYSPIVEPNLYTDDILIPNVTFTAKYSLGPAGQIFVHKLDKKAVTVGTPGRDFTDVAADDTLIPIALNNNYQQSRKLYGVQANAVAFDMGEEYLSDAIRSVRESRRYSALACMAQEGQAVQSTAAITTADGAVSNLLMMRKQVKDNHGEANFALVSTNMYMLLLEKIGFAEVYDPAVRTAELLRRYGLTILECNGFDAAEAKYYDSTGTLKTVDLTSVDMIVGSAEAFSLVDNLEVMRIVDSEMFAGSKAQVEINSGMKVTSAEQIVVKKTSI
jgi:hypothetical protein